MIRKPWAAVTLLLIGVFTGSLQAREPEDPCVRAGSRRLQTAVSEGRARSLTFRRLVDRIGASNVIVYLDDSAHLGIGVGGQLSFVSHAGGRRYVRVLVDQRLEGRQLIALVGHELEHAVEVADASDVVDQASMARLYARIGFSRRVANGGVAYDTGEAIAAGGRIMRELGATVTTVASR